MNAQLPPEPPFYEVDDETRELLIDLVEFAIQYKNCQRSDSEAQMVQSVIDTVGDRFGLILGQTEYDIEQQDNGDILWRLIKQPDPETKTQLKLVTDNSNVTPLRKRTEQEPDDSDS